MPTVPHSRDGDSFNILFDREEDGRWVAEVPELPGVLVYGTTKPDAEANVIALALRVIADGTQRPPHGKICGSRF